MSKGSSVYKAKDLPTRTEEQNRVDSLFQKLKFEVSQEIGLSQSKEKNQN